MKKLILIATILMVLGVVPLAQADSPYPGTQHLYNRGGGLIYDADINITWYDFTYNSSWNGAKQWAADLSITVNGITYDDWRLPTALNPDGSGPCSFYNCPGSEMGHLYYTELGNVAGPAAGPHNNTGPFTHFLYNNNYYWTSTATDGNVWVFGLVWDFGGQGTFPPDWVAGGMTQNALAVRNGDVAVPEPTTMLLLGLGLIGLAGVRRKMSRY